MYIHPSYRVQLEGKSDKIKNFFLKIGHGSTCYGLFEIISIDKKEKWMIVKHNGHSEYLNRMAGVERCRTYYSLFNLDVSEKEQRMLYGEGLIHFEGHFTKEKRKVFDEFIKNYEE